MIINNWHSQLLWFQSLHAERLLYLFELLYSNSDAGRDWRQEEKGTTEDEMAGWHHRLDGRDSE